ncbi:MAG: CRISPR-associated endonuclease Cas1 [Bacteroidia bacterium]|nr:CRISPR-associated endonuclease Cas1 [Bacteroidia bacterium]
MQLLLDTNGLTVRKKNDCFWITSKAGRRLISPNRITSIAVTGDCLFSSAAIRLAAWYKIPIFFFNAAAKVDAQLWSDSFGSIATIRREQVLLALTPEATVWMAGLFQLKSAHQIQNLQWLKRKYPSRAKIWEEGMKTIGGKAEEFSQWNDQLLRDCQQNMMGLEGTLARVYWALVAEAMPEEWKFAGRSRRPAKDRFNAALNYLYGMLYSVVGGATLAAGLDTHLGFLHADEYNKPAFTFDLIEPFRPWVDGLLVEAILDGKLKPEYFEEKEGGIFVSKEGRRVIIPMFNDFMEEKKTFNHRHLSHKNQIYRFAGEFGQFLLKRAGEGNK